jgi:hypothetical protein
VKKTQKKAKVTGKAKTVKTTKKPSHPKVVEADPVKTLFSDYMSATKSVLSLAKGIERDQRTLTRLLGGIDKKVVKLKTMAGKKGQASILQKLDAAEGRLASLRAPQTPITEQDD